LTANTFYTLKANGKGVIIMELKLGDVQTTALIPLAVKANETLRKNPRFKDQKAVEIIRTLNIDTKQYDKFMSHEGVVARTIMLDRQLKGIIKKYPDTVVVNVGAGFDDRFSRVDNGRILWFDLDLPDSIAARKKAFSERGRVMMISGSALEDDWCEQVRRALAGRRSKPVFIAEGLFMYLTLEQIRTFLEVLKNNFPDGGILIAEQNSKLMQKNEKHHDTVRNTNAHFRSGTDSGQEIADLTDGIKLIEEHSFNEEMSKYSIRGKLFALLLPKMNDRWATFKW
jgi:O-methyltransferase involved in polyketide biosynthesis